MQSAFVPNKWVLFKSPSKGLLPFDYYKELLLLKDNKGLGPSEVKIDRIIHKDDLGPLKVYIYKSEVSLTIWGVLPKLDNSQLNDFKINLLYQFPEEYSVLPTSFLFLSTVHVYNNCAFEYAKEIIKGINHINSDFLSYTIPSEEFQLAFNEDGIQLAVNNSFSNAICGYIPNGISVDNMIPGRIYKDILGHTINSYGKYNFLRPIYGKGKQITCEICFNETLCLEYRNIGPLGPVMPLKEYYGIYNKKPICYDTGKKVDSENAFKFLKCLIRPYSKEYFDAYTYILISSINKDELIIPLGMSVVNERNDYIILNDNRY